MTPSNNNRIIWVTIFAIAMGFLETAVVVYLREIYYPDGFQFPLSPIATDLALTEVWREVATIIMLMGIGIANGKRASSRFAYFLYAFAIWDLFYYVFLKVLLDWPASLLTWDILFLIPAPWVGPVIAPCLVSLLMILLSFSIIFLGKEGESSGIKAKEWLFFIAGSLTLIYSFVKDYYDYQGSVSQTDTELLSDFTNYIPQEFNWWIFSTGILLVSFGITLYTIRQIKSARLSVR